MDSQMNKGILEMCLLHFINQTETYGYELLHQMSSAFPEIQERTVYAILRRLSSCGYAEAFSGTVSNGPVRKYYRLTDAGRQRLDELKQSWLSMMESIRRSGVFPS